MPQTDALTGSRLANRYRIIYRIGEGGMGVTYRAWDCETGRPVVLKCPKKEMLLIAGFPERFAREARTLASLVHPNIVPIDDLGEHDGLPYFVMPYLPGGSLANRRLRDPNGRVKPMAPATLHLWLPQVATALDFVHSAGVVHRDVKPGNVFFDSAWHAFLGDFGIAKSFGDAEQLDADQPLTATNMSIGTPEYMAPELFAPKATIDGRVDQYALAVVAYEILAGRRPFVGDSAHIVVEVMTHPLPPLSGVRDDLPPSLAEAVHRALAKSPAERFPDCTAFAAAALADVLPAADEPGVARFLCPNSDCNNNLKLPVSAAGQKGKCPRCTNQMIIAPDLSALWLVREESDEPITAPGAPAKAGTAPSAAGRRRRPPARPDDWPTRVRRSLLIAGLLATMFFGAILVSRVSTARMQLELNGRIDELRESRKRLDELDRIVRELAAERESLLRENDRLKESLQ